MKDELVIFGVGAVVGAVVAAVLLSQTKRDEELAAHARAIVEREVGEVRRHLHGADA